MILKSFAYFLGIAFLSTSFAESLKFRLIDEPRSLDWHIATTSVDQPLLMNLMEGLMQVDQDLKVVPALAEKMIVKNKGKQLVFPVRQAKWSDGVALKAQDFIDGFERLLNPATGASYAYLFFDVVGAKDYNAGTLKDFSKVGFHVENNSVVIDMIEPIAYFPHLLGFWPAFPIRKDLVAKYGKDWTKPGKLVTVGPYVLNEVVAQTKYEMKANPFYYGKRGNIDVLTAQIVKESATAIRLFDSGSLHVMQDFAPQDLPQVMKRPEFHAYPYLKLHYIGFRVQKSVASNLDLRRAITQAIDRKAILTFLGGTQTLAGSFIPPGLPAHDPKLMLPFDPAAAKKSLEKSGFKNGTPLTLMVRNSERPKLVAQMVQADLKKNLGLDLKIQIYDHKVFMTMLTQENNPMMMMTWGADYPDPDTFMQLLETNVGNNKTYYTNPEYDALVLKARHSIKPAERMKLYKDAQTMVQTRDVAVIPMFYEQNEALVSPKLKGFKINQIGYLYFKNTSL